MSCAGSALDKASESANVLPGRIREWVTRMEDGNGVITVCRVVVHLRSASWGDQDRFVVKQYPKDKEWRRVIVTGAWPQS